MVWQELSTSVLFALVFTNGVVEPWEFTFLLKFGGDFPMVISDGGRGQTFDVVKDIDLFVDEEQCVRDDLSD